jgi:hypothetical protein
VSDETIRFPTNLDRPAIEKRLAQVREAALAAGLPELASRFGNLCAMSAAQLASGVIGALDWIDGKPEHEAIARQLQMVALNLKNLK